MLNNNWESGGLKAGGDWATVTASSTSSNQQTRSVGQHYDKVKSNSEDVTVYFWGLQQQAHGAMMHCLT